MVFWLIRIRFGDNRVNSLQTMQVIRQQTVATAGSGPSLSGYESRESPLLFMVQLKHGGNGVEIYGPVGNLAGPLRSPDTLK